MLLMPSITYIPQRKKIPADELCSSSGLLKERWLILARLCVMFPHLLPAMVPECTLRAAIFKWLFWVGGREQTNLLVDLGAEL